MRKATTDFWPGDAASRGVLDALPFGVCLLDSDLRILYLHPRFDFAGLAPDLPRRAEALRTRLDDHLPPPAVAQWRHLAEAALVPADTGAAGGALELKRERDGRNIAVHVVARPVLRESRPVGVVLACIEGDGPGASILPSAAQEAARLEVARQLAVTLNHQINNPLFIVSATLEDLLAEHPPADIERRLKAALDAVWRVSSAVKQLSEIRQLVSTPYIEGFPMIDLEASGQRPPEPSDTPKRT